MASASAGPSATPQDLQVRAGSAGAGLLHWRRSVTYTRLYPSGRRILGARWVRALGPGGTGSFSSPPSSTGRTPCAPPAHGRLPGAELASGGPPRGRTTAGSDALRHVLGRPARDPARCVLPPAAWPRQVAAAFG